MTDDEPVILDEAALNQALIAKLRTSCTASWRIRVPAIPALVDEYVALWESMLKPQRWSGATDQELRVRLVGELDAAFKTSARSSIVLDWTSNPDQLTISRTVQSIGENYDAWMDSRGSAPFGSHADARVWLLAEELSGRQRGIRVLDIGAGTGRNALALARHGYLVDAVEMSTRFAAQIRANAAAWKISDVTVLDCDVFAADELRDDYLLIFASEVVTDFRSIGQVRALFELGAKRLLPGGVLLFSAFVTKNGYVPSAAAREMGEHALCMMFTPDEMAGAVADLPLELIGDDSVHDYEKAHLPEQAWPPTTWYVNWTKGRDVFRGLEGAPPLELRWLAYRRVY